MTLAVKMADARYDGYEEGISIGLATGREEGISIGLERGAYQTKLETAKQMLKLSMPLEQVQICTDLPLETIQELLSSTPLTNQ